MPSDARRSAVTTTQCAKAPAGNLRTLSYRPRKTPVTNLANPIRTLHQSGIFRDSLQARAVVKHLIQETESVAAYRPVNKVFSQPSPYEAW